jgi:hypothetical protein
VLSKAPQRLRARLAREVSKVFDAPSKAEARKRLEQVKLHPIKGTLAQTIEFKLKTRD